MPHLDANWSGDPGAVRRSRTGFVLFYGYPTI